MKKTILPLLIVVALSACSTAYKTGGTPDDVYFSPASASSGYEQNRYEEYTSSNEENYLRMKVRNRYRWDGIDDYAYWNDSRYDFGYACVPSRSVLLNPFNPYIGFGYTFYSPWNSWYSPYSTIVYYKNPRAYYSVSSTRPLLTAYRNTNYSNTNRNNFGNFLGKTFGTGNNGYNSNSNTRTFSQGVTPSNNAGGRSGGFSSSGSSAGSSRPPR